MTLVFQPGVFQPNVFQTGAIQNTSTVSGGGAGGFSSAWHRFGSEQARRRDEREEKLAAIRASRTYQRLLEKLRFIEEFLNSGENVNRSATLRRIAEIEHELAMMERV